MLTSDFDYFLPPDRIAQEPARPRDSSRLMVLDRRTGALEQRHFFDVGNYLRPGDLLVVNRSKVFKARLMTTDGVEIFLLRPDRANWLALAKPGRKLKIGSEINFSDGTSCIVMDKKDDGTVVLDFKTSDEKVLELAERIGQVPTPPYIGRGTACRAPTVDDYQTVYAKEVGSVAAPTAGFHFTPELIAKLKTQGVKFAEVILHVGLGTFRPVKTETLEEHEMHEEWVDIPSETLEAIAATKKSGGRVIAVGTTTVRALESLESLARPPLAPPSQGGDSGEFEGVSGFTKIFITPGYKFKIIDGLVTNFHLPKSTLIVLISAFVGENHLDADWGRRTVLAAYSEAISNGYRFYSFGDAMLIV